MEPLTPTLQLCRDCGLPQVTCNGADCGALNRSFIKFCRNCRQGDDEGRPAQVSDAWAKGRRTSWDRLPVAFGPGELVAEIPVGTEPGNSNITLAFIDGLLAVHQPGVFRGLARPFAHHSADAWVWSDPDGSTGKKPRSVKAYEPLILNDRRHFVFSDEDGLSILDVWSCVKLFACNESPRVRRLSLSGLEAKLVAAPVPLPDHRFGLLILDTSAKIHRWLTWDLKQDQDTDLPDRLRAAKPTEIVGESCQRDILEGRFIAFSTTAGHWVWELDKAKLEDVASIKKTWPLNKPETYAIPSGKRSQAFSMRHSDDQDDLLGFDWYFQASKNDEKGGLNQTYNYRVIALGLVASEHEVLLRSKEAIPFGEWTNDAGTSKILFRVGDGLFRGDGVAHQFQEYPGVFDSQVVSLQLQGPLVLMEGQGTHAGRDLRFFRMFSLTDQTVKARTNLVHQEDKSDSDLISHHIRSQPLLWSRWMFTVEEHQGTLGVRRREITFQDRSSS